MANGKELLPKRKLESYDDLALEPFWTAFILDDLKMTLPKKAVVQTTLFLECLAQKEFKVIPFKRPLVICCSREVEVFQTSLKLAPSNMNNSLHHPVVEIPFRSVSYTNDKSSETTSSLPQSPFLLLPPNGSHKFKQNKADSFITWMNKVSRRADSFALGVCQHVWLGPNISGTVISKLSLGAKIIQRGGVVNVFKQMFSVGEGEKLLKACQCYLSTTAGPIAGLLFISTDKIAFCSERSLTFTSPSGELFRTFYKVLIPLKKINRVDQSENANRRNEKYIRIVTVDNFEFWFMGFLNYQKAFKHLQQAISRSMYYAY